MKFGQIKDRKRFCLFLASLCFVWLFLDTIPLKLVIAHYQVPYPQAILTLGGDLKREVFTAQFAQTSSLPIWISKGKPEHITRQIFSDWHISQQRLHIDRRAVDTVTNLTSLVEDLKKEKIKHIYLITSDTHMPRAIAIATIVLGSQGIAFTPVPVPSRQHSEPKIEILRDSGRALFWLITGRTGASLKKN